MLECIGRKVRLSGEIDAAVKTDTDHAVSGKYEGSVIFSEYNGIPLFCISFVGGYFYRQPNGRSKYPVFSDSAIAPTHSTVLHDSLWPPMAIGDWELAIRAAFASCPDF